MRSALDSVLSDLLSVRGKKYFLFGYFGNNQCWYMEVSFLGSNLSPAQKAINKEMSSTSITLGWMFKEVNIYRAAVEFKRNMKLLDSPIETLYQAFMSLNSF